MTTSETSSKAGAKSTAARGRGAAKSKRKTVTKTDAGGQAQAVKGMLTKIETKMKGNKMKATLGDYIRYAEFALSGTATAGAQPSAPSRDAVANT